MRLRNQTVREREPNKPLVPTRTGEPLYSVAPSFFDAPFVQIVFLAVCGAVQASILWWLVSPRRAHSAR